ncbi:MAG: hypothetical protein OXG33_01545 [Chloroflexi bacterium]|nr:hypothetical protein [Chloroflexota bacterium]
MWQSVLRIVFALLTSAVGASLLIGTVYAKGPIPEPPDDLAFMDIPPLTGQPLQPEGDPPSRQVFTYVELEVIPLSSTKIPSAFNVDVLMSNGSECSRHRVTRFERYGPFTVWELWSETYWCYNGSIITNDPDFDYEWNPGVAPPWWLGAFVDDRGDGGGSTGGGKNKWSHSDTAWGKYAICKFPDSVEAPGTATCNDPITVTINKVQYANGTANPSS